MEANLMNPISPTDYLRTAPSSRYDRELHADRVINLGELFFNLQLVPGVRYVFKAIKDNPRALEDRVVELTAGKLLFLYRIPFRFIPTSQKKTCDYDLEILFPDGTKACCEAKCKVEATDIGLKTLQNSLTTARKQLPKEHCGIVIVSTPQRWFDDKEFKSVIEETAEWYWTQTKRVALLVFYSNDFVPLGEHFHLRAIALREFINPNSRYAERVGAGLFQTAPKASNLWVDFIQVVRQIREQPKPE